MPHRRRRSSRLLPRDTARVRAAGRRREAAASSPPAARRRRSRRWLTSLIPPQPDRGGGDRGDGAADPLHAAASRWRSRAVAAPTRATLVGFFQAFGDAMLVARAMGDRSLAPIGVFALVLPLAAHAGAALAGAIGFYIVAYSVGMPGRHLLLLSGRGDLRRASRCGASRGPRFRRSSSRSARAPRSRRCRRWSRAPSADSGCRARDRIRAAAGGVDVQVRRRRCRGPSARCSSAGSTAFRCTLPQLATIAFAAVFLAFAVPGVPRGAFIMLTPLFLAIGLPAEGIGLLIAVDAIPDTFATVLNVTGDLAATTLVSPTPAENTPA